MACRCVQGRTPSVVGRCFSAIVCTTAIAAASWARCQEPLPRPPDEGLFHQHIGDYDSELRRPDGRVDIDAMVTRLQELGVSLFDH